jgi:Xaa-Pro aminopeptidase
MGHFLGLDVHDAGLYVVDGKPRALEPGLCFTVEPGLYIPATDTSAPVEFRGIGVRIEDNVVVTATGVEVLTGHAPKEIQEIEEIVGRG